MVVVLHVLMIIGLSSAQTQFVEWQNDSIALSFGYHADNVTFVGPTSNETLSMSGYKLNVTAMDSLLTPTLVLCLIFGNTLAYLWVLVE